MKTTRNQDIALSIMAARMADDNVAAARAKRRQCKETLNGIIREEMARSRLTYQKVQDIVMGPELSRGLINCACSPKAKHRPSIPSMIAIIDALAEFRLSEARKVLGQEY